MNGPLTYNSQAKRDPNQIIKLYAPLVKRIAHHLMGRLPASVQVDDLIQAGMIGLLEAQQNYDPSKGASFETFAGIRIRGSMLDDLRRGDWIPRSVHKHNRLINDAINKLERQLLRDPTDIEIANFLEISLEQYYQMLNDVNTSRLVGIEDAGLSDDMGNASDEILSENYPLNAIIENGFNEALVSAIKSLPEREALLLSLYYEQELNLKEIGAVLGVSESRVSQIHSQATQRLQAKLINWQAE